MVVKIFRVSIIQHAITAERIYFKRNEIVKFDNLGLATKVVRDGVVV